ncbi:hypothetical protein B484DRAFT_454208 [Ochromonadaceae sp. CCMP2298]|nr:hypothetical protein B484DRAFT_454208 [Ochromonadaceae sp. CCMP2298]
MLTRWPPSSRSRVSVMCAVRCTLCAVLCMLCAVICALNAAVKYDSLCLVDSLSIFSASVLLVPITCLLRRIHQLCLTLPPQT